MKKSIIRILATLGAMYVVIGILVFGWGYISKTLKSRIAPGTVLEADFEFGITDYSTGGVMVELFGTNKISVLQVVQALERASEDDRVWGLVAKVGENDLGLAHIQEIRDAVLRFRAKGKKAIAWAETFGEFGPGNKSYYLSTAFDEIYMLPSGDIGLTGLIYESPFIAGTLNKLLVKPQFDHRYEYKNFMNMITEQKYTKPHKESLTAVMNSQFSQIVEGISESRGMEPAKVRELINTGPLFGKQAIELELIDGLAYRDEVYSSAKRKAGATAHFLYLDKYLTRIGTPWNGERRIALIYGVGAVGRGVSGFSPLAGRTMGSDSVSKAFRDAMNDEKVEAIIFRIDSPGGSAVASDVIWRETVRAQAKGIPVIVSMGAVAGSGGYWIAMSADKIVAHPSTITGSIGVLGGKMYTRDMWAKIGITWDEVHTSDNSTMWSSVDKFTDPEWSKFQSWLDKIYDEFITKVAEGRGIPKDKVHGIAKGRIWTGEDAIEIGLVDKLGGFIEAMDLAKQAAGIPITEAVNIRVYPRRKTLQETIIERLAGVDDDDNSNPGVRMNELNALMRTAAPLLRQTLVGMGLSQSQGVLSVPNELSNCCY